MPSLFECQYPPELRTREEAFIASRRGAAGLNERQQSQPVVGLAFSGGGIRSATFCLGVLRALAGGKKDDPNYISLRGIDILSTVSGGGYVGAFLGALFSRDDAKPESVEQQLTSPSSAAVHWLRENGRYLAPNGSGDQWLAASTVLRNWVAVAVVLSTTVLAVLMLAQLARVIAGDVLPSDILAAVAAPFAQPVYSIYWSPLLVAPLIVLAFVATPFGWAYWLGRWQSTKVDHGWVWAMTIVVTVGAAVGAVVANAVVPLSTTLRVLLIVLAIVGALTLLVAVVLSVKADGDANYVSGQRTFRNLASRALTGSVIVTAALLGVALVDTVGQTLYVFAEAPHIRNALVASLAAAIGVLLAAGQKITTFLDKGDKKKHVAIPLAVVTGIAGMFVTFALVAGLSAVSHTIARGQQVERCASASPVSVSLSSERHIVVDQAEQCEVPLLPTLRPAQTTIAAVVLVVLTLLLGQSLPFVNLSSLTQFYSARLSRTYIGASNKIRQTRGATMTTEMPGDDLEMPDYSPHAHGGPMHLINVTLNETVGGRSQVEDRDRKGLAMAIGPAGLSIGVTHHARWKDATRMAAIEPISAPSSGGDPSHSYHVWSKSPQPIEPKRLSLSQWTAISGAAVATGMGAQTRLGLSLLLGIGNVRLGYWWDSKVEPEHQGGALPKPSILLQRWIGKVLPVQSALMEELLAQFHGPHRQNWYLTDGGHFENTACYEFLRRRVPLIIVCDDGADPNYEFGDLANLVRKARLDFNATVKFLSADDDVVGHFSELKRTMPENGVGTNAPKVDLGIPLSRRHLLLARIDYPDQAQIGSPANQGSAHSLVLVIKPSLTGDEPLDVLQYAASHPTFPQEPTSDQFFDEAQWESYRRLGEHIGSKVIALDIAKLWEKVSDDEHLV
jgi:hypothetical protein